MSSNSYKPSDTFKLLNNQIIEELIYQMLDKDDTLSLNVDNNKNPCIEIARRFERYRSEAVKFVKSNRLDRHKLAACICISIVEVNPLKDTKGKGSNELLAIYTALNIIKLYMMFDLSKKDADKERLEFIKEKFDMECPPLEDNIRDTKSYRVNLVNALKRTQIYCKDAAMKCSKFDIWAYADIFYHLEVYNKPRFDAFCVKHKVLNLNKELKIAEI